ncbi:MAG: hypothetical protein GX126_00495 [Bacteroidales bacterium]|jgi:hypothetical protein|nr:hypothetical protein [Bacteroidales bacterium]
MEKKRIIDLHLDEFKNCLEHIIDERINKALVNFHKGEELVSRKQVKERLGIAYSTLDDYSKKGILKSYRISGRIFFKWSEIVDAAKRVDHYPKIEK